MTEKRYTVTDCTGSVFHVVERDGVKYVERWEGPAELNLKPLVQMDPEHMPRLSVNESDQGVFGHALYWPDSSKMPAEFRTKR